MPRSRSRIRKKAPPRKKKPRTLRWWDWALLASGFVIAFAFLMWAGKGGALTPNVELPTPEATPTAAVATPVAAPPEAPAEALG